MKKTLFVAALAAVLVFAFAATAFAYGPIWSGSAEAPYNANYPGYLKWDSNLGGNAGAPSPHGNYATTTNKCAVCHAVHRAQAGGQVLTAWTGNAGLTGDALATGSCIFCHGESATFTDVNINTESASSLSPHGRCQRCHTPSPHGAGASEFPLFKSKLFIAEIDDAINTDLAAAPTDANYNGLTGDMFDLSDPALVGTGLSLGTGYLCANCHDNASNPVVFAVNTFGATPTITGLGTTSTKTGHRVTAMATTSWNQNGEFDAYFTGGGAPGAESQVAFNNANSCKACHDAYSAGIDGPAFPHNYVDAAGTSVPKTTLGSALVWLTTAADADDARVVSGKVATGTTGNGVIATQDGLCLKCHVSGDGTAGVGITY